MRLPHWRWILAGTVCTAILGAYFLRKRVFVPKPTHIFASPVLTNLADPAIKDAGRMGHGQDNSNKDGAAPTAAAVASESQPYPGPDRRLDRIGWIAWKLDGKRKLMMQSLFRACPEAAPIARDLDAVHRVFEARLLDLARRGKIGELDKDEFRRAEAGATRDLANSLSAQMRPVIRTPRCIAHVRKIVESTVSTGRYSL